MSKSIQETSLAQSFVNVLASIRDGAGNSEALKADFKKKLYATSGKPLPSQSKKPVKAKPVSQMKKTQKTKAKPKAKARPVKREAFEDTIENRVMAQREARKGGKIRLFAKKVKSDIADRVAKQRRERKAKDETKKPKDPKKVKSRPLRIGN